MSLKTRLTIIIVGLIAFLFVGYLSSFFVVEKRFLTGETEKSRQKEAERLAWQCREAALLRNNVLAEDYVGEAKGTEAVLWAACLDGDGIVLAHTAPSHGGQRWRDDATLRALEAPSLLRALYRSDGAEVLEYAAPVVIDDERIGVARLVYDASSLRQSLAGLVESTLRRFLWIAAVSLLLGILMSFYVAEGLTRPVQLLMEGARRIGEGHLETRVEIRRKDEIGRLAGEFNGMAVRLAELDQMKDEFVATVSHDLRNPLSAISMSADYALTGKGHEALNDFQKDMLTTVYRSAQRLTAMVNNILDAAKIKQGKVDFNKAVLDPRKVLEEIHRLYEPMAETRKKKLLLSLPEALPSIEADEEKFHRVFTNLVSNSMKFTKPGDSVTLGAQLTESPSFIQFYVADTGPGIPPEAVPKLFRKFSSVEGLEPELRKQQGTGLGLAIVKMIVEGHGGKIWIESQVGQGTTIRWTWPAAQAAQETQQPHD